MPNKEQQKSSFISKSKDTRQQIRCPKNPTEAPTFGICFWFKFKLVMYGIITVTVLHSITFCYNYDFDDNDDKKRQIMAITNVFIKCIKVDI